jgi:hypothetical protein
MVVAWLMVGTGETFALDAVGAWAIESLVYFFIGTGVAFLGAGRYAVGKDPRISNRGLLVGPVSVAPPGLSFTVYARTRSPCGWQEQAST